MKSYCVKTENRTRIPVGNSYSCTVPYVPRYRYCVPAPPGVFLQGYCEFEIRVMPTLVRDKLPAIASATVSDLSGAPIAISSLYQGGGAVVMLVRRLG